MILAGDIGGTNTRLALFDAKSGRLELHSELTYPSREHASLDEIVVSFVAQAQRPIDAACFGIAGPVKEGRAATPNLAWIVEAQSLARALKLQRVFLLNDLESIAYGTAALAPADYAVISPGAIEQGNRAVIAAGTGLGEAGLEQRLRLQSEGVEFRGGTVWMEAHEFRFRKPRRSLRKMKRD